MRTLRFFSLWLLLLGGVSVLRADSTLSERVRWTPEQWEEALAPYLARARATFPEALRRYRAGQDDEVPPVLVLLSRREGTDGEPVDIVMRVSEITPTGIFEGEVRGAQRENSPLAEGDKVGIVESEIRDWALTVADQRQPDGLVVERARKAMLGGVVALVYELQADRKGRLIHAKMSRAMAVPSGEDVTDIVPPGAPADGLAYLGEYYKDNEVPRPFIEVSLYYTFPGGERIKDSGDGE